MVGLRVDHGPKGNYEGCVGHDTEGFVDRERGAVRVSSQERNDILNEEEEQRDDDSDLGPGQEDLDEEVLDDEDKVEEDEEEENHTEGDMS